MTITINGTTGITNDGGYTGDGVVFADTTPANTLVTTTGGNVGMGTSSPATTLHARKDSAGGTTYALYTDNGAAGAGTNIAGIGFVNAGSIKASITAAVYGNDYMAFNVGGSGTTERARIDSSGNLLVGTTSDDPIASRVNAFVWYQQNPTLRIRAVGTQVNLAVANTSGAHIQFFTDNGSAAVAAGNITSNGSSTSYNSSSDYRLKHDIQPMTGALARVAALKPVTYKWKVDGSDGEGFIAHELQEVCPDAVTGEKDAVDAEGNPQYQGIDTSFLVATLTAAIQEQQQIITALTARVAALDARLTSLEGTQP